MIRSLFLSRLPASATVIGGFMIRRFCGAVFLAALVLSSTQTRAQLGKVPPTQVVVTAAVIDSGVIQIEGVNFGANPIVFVAGIPVDGAAVNATGTAIVAP